MWQGAFPVLLWMTKMKVLSIEHKKLVIGIGTCIVAVILSLNGCGFISQIGGGKDMISVEVKEQMNTYLSEKYGETFVVGHIDFNQSSASNNVIYSSNVYPTRQPEIVFRCTLNRATEELEDNYPQMDLSYRYMNDVLEAFEAKTSNDVAMIRQLMFMLPFGKEIVLGDSLEETFAKNPEEVSLLIDVIIEKEAIAEDAIVDGIRMFVDDYVKNLGYNYITLHVWYMPASSIEKYKEGLSQGWDVYDNPSEDMYLAVFSLVEKVSQIDGSRFAESLVIS